MKRKQIATLMTMLAIALGLASCGGSGSSGGTGSSGTIGVSVITAASTLDGTNSTTLTASVTNDKNAAGVTWSVTGGGALSNQTTSSATYTAPAATAAAQTITVTATSVADSTKNATSTITVPAQLNVSTANSSLAGAVGTNYSASLTASGGISPFTWTVASGSTLPAGLSMTTAGIISGTPTAAAAGNTSVTFNVKDSGTPTALTATQTLTLNIAAAPGLTFTGTVPATATLNTAYAGGSAAASGGSGTLTYSISSGALPSGILLNTANGAITGTPTAVGPFNFTVKVTDAFGDQSTKAYQIVVSYPALSITTSATLPSATVGVNYSATLAASGGTGISANYSWATANGSSLPAGLTLSSSGVLSGKPTTATGSTPATFTVTVTDSVASLSANTTFSLVVGAGLSITTTTVPNGNVGMPYSVTLAATGGTGGYTWTASAGTLTSFGLSLSSAGVISGTPTAQGSPTVFATVTDSSNTTATKILSPFIYPAFSQVSSSLPTTVNTNTAYSGTITATGGSGSYSWAVTGLSDNLTSSASGATLSISGTPGTATTISFNVVLTDTNTNNTVSQGYSIVVSTAASLGLPLPNPITLPAATQGTAYTGSINATGGVSPYTWTVNSTPIPTNNAQVSIGSGLYVSNGGNNVLQVSGTPNASGLVTLDATVKDSTNVTASQSYSITVNASGYTVTGNYYLNNLCPGVSAFPALTMTISTPTPQSVTTDSSGNFSFANIPNGSYTITPSSTAPEAVFSPSTLSVTVNNGAVSAGTFAVALGYDISGYVTNSSTQTGSVYVWAKSSCAGGNPNGTWISPSALTSGGAFAIHGLPIGTYTLFARMDPQGNGFPMGKTFPLGATTNVTISTASLTNQTVALADPAAAALTASPTFNVVSGTDQGVIVDFNLGTDVGTDSYGNTVINAPYYQVEWSSTTSFASPNSTNSFVFPSTAAIGAGVIFLNNQTSGVSGSPFTNGAQLYFRIRGYVASGSSNNGPWNYFGGSSAASSAPVTIGAPTGSNTITGTATFAGTATGPLYVGYFSTSTGQFYGQRIANPVSPQSFTAQVPTGSSFMLVATVDNNNDGLIDAGDFANSRPDGGPPTVSVTGPASGVVVAIPTTDVVITTTTQNTKYTNAGNTTSNNYGVYFDLRYSYKTPVAVQIVSGPNVLKPVDIGRCLTCGAVQFQYGFGIATAPVADDTYTFQITYLDGTTEQLTGKVTGLNTAFATALVPQQQVAGNTKPTFSWNYPSSASSYGYNFNLWSASGTTIWQIPASSSSTFTSTQIPSTSGGSGITWGVDPLGGTNLPSVSALTTGTTYYWSLVSTDANGNTATRTIYFVP
jgi:hypothetical protein